MQNSFRLRLLLWIMVAASFHLPIDAQAASSEMLSRVSLALPNDVASGGPQIEYFLSGPFGGYGAFLPVADGRSPHEIVAGVDGRPATDVKVIAYVPGCAIVALDIPLKSVVETRMISCEPLGMLTLRGEISPRSLVSQSAVLDVSYVAYWSHEFFGIRDGPVTTLRLGAVTPDVDGQFEISVPDFYSGPRMRDGALELMLRESKTGNRIALLQPEGQAGDDPRFMVRPAYPLGLRFVAEYPQ